MLEKYKITQKLAYRILTKAISKNEYSHAYIFESNGYNEAIGLAKDFAKALFCVEKENVNISHLIDENNYPDLKIIDPEGLIIKKEEINELQELFKVKPIYGDKKIYIINNAERLNKSAGNSLLKFLEEPENNIVAILITNNLYEMMDTIVSRCQIIPLIKDNSSVKDLSMIDKIINNINKTKEEINIIFGNDESNVNLTKCIDFVNYYEKNKLDTYIYLNDYWFNYYKDKAQMDIAFKIMSLYYIDILKKKCQNKIDIFDDYDEQICQIQKNLSISNLCQKINIIISLEKKIMENNNLNLIMDKLLIELGRSEINV